MNSPARTKTHASKLWLAWEKTLRKSSRRIVLIDAGMRRSLTANALNEEAIKFIERLSAFPQGTRLAFCLPNGAEWMAFFLATQKLGLAAIPLDAGLPEPACMDVARQLGCRALFYRGTFHALDCASTISKSICCIKVTSGTSEGMPNSVPCRAEHLLADGANLIRTMGIRPEDRNLVSIPLGHSYGLGNLVVPLILQGTALICASQFVPRQLIDWTKQYRATVFPSVPALFRVLAAMPGKTRFTPLRLAISAGAPLTPEIAQTFFKRYRLKIHNFYGSSETGGICYDKTGNAAIEGRSVGKPVAGVSVQITGDTIRVSGAAVAKRNGTWRVPDRGQWNDRRELVLLGRRGREVNLGGKKVHPSEIEQALRSITGVSDVIVWEDNHSQRTVLQAGVETALPLKKIQQALATRIPEWKWPKHYVLTPELPRSERGKIDLTALRKKLQAQLV